MGFVSIRIITDQLDAMVAFYERVTGATAFRPAPVFAQISTAVATLAIGSVESVGMLPAGTIQPATNRSTFIEFLVDDVDAEFSRLSDDEWVLEPTVMPWGNRSALLRDPDGNLVNLFSRPVG